MRCLDCFDEFEQEQAKRETEPHGEVLVWCPSCGSGSIYYLFELDANGEPRSRFYPRRT